MLWPPPSPIGLSTKMRNKENTVPRLALLKQSFEMVRTSDVVKTLLVETETKTETWKKLGLVM